MDLRQTGQGLDFPGYTSRYGSDQDEEPGATLTCNHPALPSSRIA
jgi:hypothetical protein